MPRTDRLDAQLGAASVARAALAAWLRSQMINWDATETEVAHLDTLRGGGRDVRESRRKCGEETVELLAELLDAAGDAERTARIGRLLAECETSEELIAKAART